MELVVHGTKQGYKSSFIPNVQPTFALGDIRNGVNNENPLGKSAYSLAFIKGGCVYTKYTIVRDTLRAYATGNIAFSLFLHANKELTGKGADVKSLLDDLSQHYFNNYIINNNINRDEEYLIHEDWSFIQSTLSKYTEIDKSKKTEEIVSGTSDPAFHYYESDNELIEHFDNPYQEEYKNYRQILFIDSNIKGQGDPLKVLKNSGIEVIPDLKNEYYYLNNFNTIKGIRITANGKTRSERKGENQIRAKWQVEIKYSKDDKCFEPVHEVGTISDLSSGIHQYIEIKGNYIMLRYDAFNNPNPIVVNVAIVIRDRDGVNVEHAEIFYETTHQQESRSTSNIIPFKGEDIIKKWTFYAKKESENLYSSPVFVTPKNQNDPVVLTLLKHKKILFQGELKNGNNTQYFPEIKISIQGKSVYSQKPECDFIDDEIKQTYIVTATCSSGGVYLQGESEFCPKDINSVSIELKKSKQENLKYYALDMGSHASASAAFSNTETGNEISVIIKTKGYIFKGFILDKNKKHGFYEGTLIAQYEKPKPFITKTKTFFSKPPVIAAVSLSLIIVLAIITYNYSSSKKELIKSSISYKLNIEEYIKGDLLILQTLKEYKNNWSSNKELVMKSNQIDSMEWENDWLMIDDVLDKAIEKRELINSLKFIELKKQGLVNSQSQLGIAINQIDSANYAEVQNGFGDVSTLTLSEIADKINKILKQVEINKEELPQLVENGNVQTEEIIGQLQQDQIITELPIVIKRDLQSATITKQKLKEYSEDSAVYSKFKNSITLYQDFWNLVNSSGTPQKINYDSLLEKVNKDNVLKSSELKSYLNSICTNSDEFQKFISIRGKATCERLLELKEKNNQL